MIPRMREMKKGQEPVKTKAAALATATKVLAALLAMVSIEPAARFEKRTNDC
jgi:hypothetical protein